MKVVGVPEAKWTEIRGMLMRVLLDEHDNIVTSSAVIKRRSGEVGAARQMSGQHH